MDINEVQSADGCLREGSDSVSPIALSKADHLQARAFYFSTAAYYTFILPSYFDFQPLLSNLSEKYPEFYRLQNNERTEVRSNVANYRLLWNKDGAYAWRPMELAHPALYANLVALMTTEENWKKIQQRFRYFSDECEGKVKVASLPTISLDQDSIAESNIMTWWTTIEQESIRLSLKYKYVTISDITNCYGSMYTHTIAWALHGKEEAKRHRGKFDLLGNTIDCFMQDMNAGQTNGIPQGNEISNLISELVLGFADTELVHKIQEKHGGWETGRYKILRYRDDYRIFTNTAEDSNEIMLLLTGVLADLNLKINSSKTKVSDDIISVCIKKDKIDRLITHHFDRNLQKNLLLIRESGKRYRNSGSLNKNLAEFRKRLDWVKTMPKDNDVLLPIVVDIMHANSRTYPTCASIIGKLLDYERNDDGKVGLIDAILTRFNDIPNIGYLEIWLQRISISVNQRLEHHYDDSLCRIQTNQDRSIWNSDWIHENLDIRDVVESTCVVNQEEWGRLSDVIPVAETELFVNDSYPG
ncbi:RNA-directed DNA polymerase [Bifidobacterium sp. ESL0790]|uniref:RNA-directed DNA polymerase n=1 Tax=Bifidobacterium sp. ESL0790 TaxID=2983233 RepID=UPI0023F77A23|nr:RNA-directed DNA polymerase [Bifidobacterium sp. ESL0790]WEV71996.1 RNA-directed DNA polymerase [Bifidobacterium sp. ESL0790]